jgi:hypothetical protein
MINTAHGEPGTPEAATIEMLKALFKEKGMEASEVARHIVEGVLANRFWIFPAPEFFDPSYPRVAQIREALGSHDECSAGRAAAARGPGRARHRASQGIGRGIALELAERGATVYVTARSAAGSTRPPRRSRSSAARRCRSRATTVSTRR